MTAPDGPGPGPGPVGTSPTPLLRRGDRGEAVRDLQARLTGLGHDVRADEVGEYGTATEAAVRSFQESRQLRVDGICGRQTWGALVECGFAIGDRLLYVRQPMLRGDDVVELQRRLNALGFDAGREDGIFGPHTGRGLRDFQRNAGLTVDGILGPATLAALGRLGALAGESVASVREREELRQSTRRLEDRRVFLAVTPGLATLGDVVARSLTASGAHVVLDPSGTDDSLLAAEANRFEADLFLAIRPGDRPGVRCLHFASGTFRSAAGYGLARAICTELTPVLGEPEPAEDGGRRVSALRETRMAAVICEPAAELDATAMRHLVAHVAEVGIAIADGVRRAIEHPELDLTQDEPARDREPNGVH